MAPRRLSTTQRRRRRAPAEAQPAAQRWLVSYADLVTLLLALFVVLYAASSLDANKWRGVSASVKDAFAAPLETPPSGAVPGVPFETPLPSGREAGGDVFAWELARLERRIESIEAEARGAEESQAWLSVERSGRGLLLTLGADALFEAGTASLSGPALAFLDELAGALRTSGASVRVDGHTDDRAVTSRAYASNWELSSARAGAVARRLIERHRIGARRVAIAGFADQRPLASHATPAERRRNRRIEIRVDAPENAGPGGADLRELLDQLAPAGG